MVGENLKFTCLEWLKNALKLTTMIKENLENYLPQMAINALKLPTMVGENLKFTCLKWLKMHLNYPPWLEKILKFTCLEWLKMQLN